MAVAGVGALAQVLSVQLAEPATKAQLTIGLALFLIALQNDPFAPSSAPVAV